MGKGSGRKRVWRGGVGRLAMWREEMELERDEASAGVAESEEVGVFRAAF